VHTMIIISDVQFDRQIGQLEAACRWTYVLLCPLPKTSGAALVQLLAVSGVNVLVQGLRVWRDNNQTELRKDQDDDDITVFQNRPLAKYGLLLTRRTLTEMLIIDDGHEPMPNLEKVNLFLFPKQRRGIHAVTQNV
jgi:hypothetical protein